MTGNDFFYINLDILLKEMGEGGGWYKKTGKSSTCDAIFGFLSDLIDPDK